ncbi:unnamed protein product [Didymodactylos carnosus]|uniref:Uncharacterized protein n=2 Tax=Didymodactylos carnosus TaxID=1234261 RepID=A0A8S2EPF6_9BILA|nr:unnamed protein product [Didymodactylos carnosus]CAF4009530.1 unnamed protein product [Didymodactylos carnosus]
MVHYRINYPTTFDNDARIDGRTLIPRRITLTHAFMFSLVKLNYWIHCVFCLLYSFGINLKLIKCYRTSAEDVCELIINTSLALYVKLTQLNQNKQLLVFNIENVAFPEISDKYDNTLAISAEIELDDNGQRCNYTITKFEFNNLIISDHSEQLTTLTIILSIAIHPIIHSYFDKLYNHNYDNGNMNGHKELESKYDDILLHGQRLNYSSWESPGFCFGSVVWFGKAVTHNSMKLIVPPHSAIQQLAQQPISLNFMLEARRIIFELIRKYKVPMDAELFFLCSVLHAVDHYECSKRVRYHNLTVPTIAANFARSLNYSWTNFLAQFFFAPNQYIFTNLLRHKYKKNSFYNELYQLLYEVNPKHADQVTLSMSY